MIGAREFLGRVPASALAVASRLRRGSQKISEWLDRGRGLLTVASALIITVLCWPIVTVAPQIGLDPSWITAMHLAMQRHLLFGSQLDYTSGPLGFLGLPQPYFGWTSALALVFVLTVSLVASVWVVYLLRRAFPFWFALPTAYAIARTFGWVAGWNLVGVIVFLCCVELLRRYGARSIPTRAFVVLGLVTGVCLLGKINIGVTIGGLAGLLSLVATSRRRPAVVIFCACTGAAFIVTWLALGQSPWDIPLYVRYGMEIAAGYSQAMGLDYSSTMGWVYVLALVAIGTVALAAYESSDRWPRTERLTLLALVAIMAFSLFKAGFVRNDFGTFFANAMFIVPIFAIRGLKARMTLSVATLAVSVMLLSSGNIVSYIDPSPNLEWSRQQLSAAVLHPAQATADTITQMRALYALPPEALAAIGEHPVQIEPFDAGVAFAYPDLKWDPIPVFQTYTAYTESLDQLDADYLASPKAPERILWLTPVGQPLTIDGRSMYLEAPRTMMEMLCRYAPIASAPAWQVWAIVPNRCGVPELLSRVTARAGEQVAVPQESRSDRLVVVHISGIASSLPERAETFLFKTPAWYLWSVEQSSRLVPGTADGPLLLGATGTADLDQGMALAPPTKAIAVGTTVTRLTHSGESSDLLTYDFYSIPIAHSTPAN